jgi:tetratricopeptide (TPR) repeat protein
LSDVAKLDLDAEQTRQASLPFQGCWLMEQARIPLVPVFRELLRHEFRDDAMEYMVRNRQRFPADIASVAGLLNDGAKLLNEGQLESAEQRFRWAILLDAQCSPAYMQLGRTLHRQGRISESEAALRQSLAIDAENVTTHFALGLLLKEIRRSAEAAESLRKVAQLRPDHIPTMFHLADILATDSNTSDGNDREANSREAILWAEKAAGLTNRQSADVLAVLAAAYAQAGRWNDAISTAEEARRVAIDTNKTNLRQQIEQNLEAYRGFRIPPPAAHRPNSSTSDVAP